MANHRWLALRVDPCGVSALQTVPDAAGSSRDPLIRLQPTGNDIGSPEFVVLADGVLGVQFARVQRVNFQASQYSATNRSWWAVFRFSNVNNNVARLGGCSFGRYSTGAGRILLPGSLRLTGPTSSKDKQ